MIRILSAEHKSHRIEENEEPNCYCTVQNCAPRAAHLAVSMYTLLPLQAYKAS
jgi:hypothetical protein